MTSVPRSTSGGGGLSVVIGDDPETERGIGSVLELLGGTVLPMPGDPTSRRAPLGIITSLDALATLSSEQFHALKSHGEETPLFLFPANSKPEAFLEAAVQLRGLGVPELTLAAASPLQDYRFADDALLWPFSGLRLAEGTQRIATAVAPDDRSIEPLISSPAGSIFLRMRVGARQVFISTISPREAVARTRLRDEFRPARFAGLLPLMLFVRASLGDSAWRAPRPRATFMIDDPNLRSRRYGFLDYGALAATARDRKLHFTLAMSPIDHGKTRPPVASFMREHRRQISLVPHGVEHHKREFARDVPVETAISVLLDGLRRMRLHEAATGVGFPLAMTFPHGACNATWLEAMHRTGFQAAFTNRAFGFKPEAEIDWPLYEMYPAEMTFRGFPIVSRFMAEGPRERLLFAAWLDKPLVVYTHHQFFRHGMGDAIELADFINRQVRPAWGDIDLVLRENYQSRWSGRERAIRAFSKALPVTTDSRTAVGPLPAYRAPLSARVRRLATEARDRSAPALVSRRTTTERTRRGDD